MNCPPTTCLARNRAGNYVLHIDQGASLEFDIVYKNDDQPVDLTGVVADSQLRKRYDSATPLVSLHSGTDGGIEIMPLEGKIIYRMTPEQTAKINIVNGVWDLRLTFPDGKVIRLLGGAFKLSKGVTR